MAERTNVNVIEVLGRNHLIASLIEDGVQAAVPMWDEGVDLIAYFDDPASQRMIVRPLQLKANEDHRWGIHRKYENVSNLLMVYVWHVRSWEKMRIFAMTYSEAVRILEDRGHTSTRSWKELGGYTIPGADARLLEALQPFEMKRGMWKERLARN